MGVRPPSDGTDDGPDVVEFGIAALDARLSDADVSFPVSTRELRSEFGNAEIPYDAAGHTMTFGEALAEARTDEFESEQDLLNALHPVFERRREATSTSILAQLRALVPF
jgi:hypothetical protein